MSSDEQTVDSRPDTYEHIHHVQEFLTNVIENLLRRQLMHDATKLLPPEKEAYDTLATRSREDIAYGSEEYRAMFRGIKPAIQHHYEHNRHHPEHFEQGIRGMTLLDLIEMLCDWKAAALRHNSNPVESMDHNQQRFGFSDELKAILLNTLDELGSYQPAEDRWTQEEIAEARRRVDESTLKIEPAEPAALEQNRRSHG